MTATIAAGPGIQRVKLFEELLDKYQYFVFDLDGVIFHGPHVIGDSIPILKLLMARGKQMYFYSNNSRRGNPELAQRLINAGFVPPKNSVISTPYLTALYLHFKHPTVKKVYLMASELFTKELRTDGFEVVVDQDPIGKFDTHGIQAVVVGCDWSFCYNRLAYASFLVKSGVDFIVADSDPYFVIEGLKCPAAAYVYEPIRKITGIAPTVLCKPAAFALELLMERDGIPATAKSRMLMIGDSLFTDIAFGQNGGIDTLLVLSGVTSPADLEKSELKPTYVSDLLKLSKVE